MNKLNKQFRAYLVLTWYAFRAQTRNRATFAFGFIFPIVFISIFGIVGSGNQKISLGIPEGTPNDNVVVKQISSQEFVSIKSGSEEDLKTQLRQGKIAGVLQVDENEGITNATLFISSANPLEADKINSFIGGVVGQANLVESGITSPPIIFNSQEISGRQSRYIDFALPGQIGFSLLSTAVFGTVFGLIYLKKALVLKRMLATPVRPILILVSQGTSRLILAMIQTVMILGIGVFVFHFYLPNGIISFFQIMVLSAFGLIAFLGFGYFMSGFAKDENSAGPLVNLITLPQFLLSGTFFSTDNLPNWIQPVANNLPLSYFNVAIRKITTEGAGFAEIWPYMLALGLWGLVMYILAAKYFRWEP